MAVTFLSLTSAILRRLQCQQKNRATDGNCAPAAETRKLQSYSSAAVARSDRCFNLMLSVERSGIARQAPAARTRGAMAAGQLDGCV